MSILSQVACSTISEGELPASDEEVAALHPLVPAWKLVSDQGRRKLRHCYTFDDAKTAEIFVRRLEAISLKEAHSVEIEPRATSVDVSAWTPAIGDIHPNDFVLAAKADGAFTFVIVGHEGDMFTDEALPKLWDLPMFRQLASRRFGQEKARVAG